MARSRSKSKFSFRDSQTQARTALICAVAATVFALLLAAIVLENLNIAEKTIPYSGSSLRYPAILAAAGLAGIFGAIGFGFGVSSLGHKRNARQRESWVGLLLGGFVVSITIVLFMLFKMFSLPIVT